MYAHIVCWQSRTSLSYSWYHTYIQAYCPPAVVEENPIMDYAKNIIFGYYGTLTVSVDGVSALHWIQHIHTYIYTYSNPNLSIYLSISFRIRWPSPPTSPWRASTSRTACTRAIWRRRSPRPWTDCWWGTACSCMYVWVYVCMYCLDWLWVGARAATFLPGRAEGVAGENQEVQNHAITRLHTYIHTLTHGNPRKASEL